VPSSSQGKGQQVLSFDELALLAENEEHAQGASFGADADEDVTRLEIMRRVGRQFSFILIPFLFALVIFLLALVFLLGLKIHSAYLPAAGLLSIGLIALAMAVLQSMMLYYSGSNNGLWFLSLLAGFILFPPVLFFALLGPGASLFTLIAMLIVCAGITKFSAHPVQEGHVGLVYSFGKYRRTVSPGLNFLPPWEQLAHVLDTRETQWICPQQTVPMSPQKDLSLAATIAYQIIPEDAHLAVLQVNDWENQLRERFRAILQTIALDFKPEDFFAWQQGSASRPGPNAQSAQPAQPGGPAKNDPPAWNRVNTRLFQLMRDQVASWGVQINWVRIHDVLPLPHVDHPEAVRVNANGPMRPGAAGASRPGAGVPPTAPSSKGQPFAPRNAASAAKPPSAAAPPPSPAPAPPAAAASANAANKSKDDVLIKAYEAVRSGSITDPETIRRIAMHFDAVARDPVANHSFPFEAARAARNLYDRAKYYEDLISASAEYGYNENDNYNDANFEDYSGETEPNWIHRPPTDDNLTAGG
jgi:regulator of protease activity HflC (stomatin/prohibitin superfamily)